MELTILEKASRKLKAIKKLDQEIIELEKLALLIANGHVDISFALNILDYAKKAEEEAKKKAEEEQGMYRVFFQPIFRIPGAENEPAPEGTTIYRSPVKEETAMRLLAVLAQEKQAIRGRLVAELQEIGIKI